MSKLSYKTLLIIFLSLLIAIVVLCKFVLPKQSVKAAWWNEGWNYRKAISINNTLGSIVNNQRIKITIDTSALITTGKMQSNCNDIRIVDINGNLLDHWDTACNTTNTNIYFKLDSIPTSGSTIYIYYGNSSANNDEKTLGTIDNPGTSCQMMKDQGSVTTNGTYYIVPGGADVDKQLVYCDQTTDGGGWALVMNQKVTTGGYFANSTEAQNYNESNPTADRYSILGKLAKFKDNGIFNFKINWPPLGSIRNIWSQTSDPSTTTSITGYTAITIDQTANSWGGIAQEGASNTFIDGSPGSPGNWYYAIASYVSWNGGIPSYSPMSTQTQLWVKGNDTMNNVSVGTPLAEEAGGAPVAYWKFDEGVGTTAYDSSSNKLNGNITGATWQSEDQCVNGKCLYFNGVSSSNKVDLGNSIKLDPSLFTISSWIKPDDASLSYGYIYSNDRDCCETLNGFSLYIGSGKLQGKIWNSTGVNISSNSTISSNKWTYVTFTYDGTNMKLYIDGKLDKTQSYTGGVGSPPSRNSSIGTMGHNQGYYTLKGYLDEFKLYPYARTADQIKLDYNSRGSSKGTTANLGVKSNTGPSLSSKLIADWKFDENQGNSTSNSTSNFGINGTLQSYASWGDKNQCIKNGCIFINGAESSPFASVSIPDSNLFSNLSQLTVSVWVKTINNVKSNQQIIYKRNQSGTPAWASFMMNINNGRPNFLVTDTSGSSTAIYSPTLLENNKWYHLVGVYTGSQMKFFINGQSAATPISKTGIILDGDGSLMIGGLDINQYVSGYIDEVKIYNSALTDDEVKQDYNQGSAIQFGATNQTIGGTTTDLNYCIPGDTSFCASPVAEYNFEENTGNIFKDTSSRNIGGTLIGTNSWTPGKQGSAITVNGSGNYAKTADIGITIASNYTIEGWVNINQMPTSGDSNRSGLIGGVNCDLANSVEFNIGGDNLTAPQIGVGRCGDYTVNYSTRSFSLNTWTHIAVIVDSSKLATYYINGQNSGTSDLSTHNTDIKGQLSIGDNSIRNTFGKIDGVKIYNYARTPAQIAYDYNKGAPVAWWKFDECQGLTAFDASGFGNNGTINIGSAGSQTSTGTCSDNLSTSAWNNGKNGKTNSSLNFDGTDDYISTSQPLSSNTFSVSTWIYHNPYTQSGDAILGNSFWNTWFTSGFVMRFWGSNTLLSLIMGSSGSDTTIAVSIPLQTWTYITMTYDGSNFKVYKNGQLVDTKTGRNYTPSSNNLRIGSDYTNSGSVSYNGQMDDIRIYNYALTPEQVKQIFNNGAINFN